MGLIIIKSAKYCSRSLSAECFQKLFFTFFRSIFVNSCFLYAFKQMLIQQLCRAKVNISPHTQMVHSSNARAQINGK